MKYKNNPIKQGILFDLFFIAIVLAIVAYFHNVILDFIDERHYNSMVIFMVLIIVSVAMLLVNIIRVHRFNNFLKQEDARFAIDESRHKELFSLTSEGLYDMDINYKMKYYSSDWYERIGLDVNSEALEAWTDLILEEDKTSFDFRLKDQLSSGQELYLSQYRILDKFGEIHWIEAVGKANFDEDNNYVSMSGVHRDITRIKENEAKILDLAYSNSLTKLPNRLKFGMLVNEAIEKGEPFILLYVDVDNFKYINDNYGHIFGDSVIAEMGARLKQIVHDEDLVAHLGSDEFAIITKNANNRKQLDSYMNFILSELNQEYELDKINISLTCSMGATTFPDDGKSYTELLVNVDIALYEAKANRNCITFYEAYMGREAIEQANIERHLVKSLDKREMYVNYQPIINMKTGELDGFEALARWKDTELGNVYPDIFIPIAEKTGFIINLGDFIMEEAIIFAGRIYDRYKTYFTMNINISTIQLMQKDFVPKVQKLLVKHQFPAGKLNLEITETVELENNILVTGRLAELRKMGIGISLDDFGTGYSSLNNLISLSVSHIKIDRSLTQQATTLEEVNRLIRGVVEFAHALNMKVVAEGIETVRMEEVISKMNIDKTQGYYYSKPMDIQDTYDYIEEQLRTKIKKELSAVD